MFPFLFTSSPFWKWAFVSSLLIKPPSISVECCRPLSRSSVRKVFEPIAKHPLIDHFMRNTLSNPAQFGYVHGRSTESHLISCSVHRIIGDWMSSLNLRVQILLKPTVCLLRKVALEIGKILRHWFFSKMTHTCFKFPCVRTNY